mmetsp:Transcript_13106/g.43343  ORF Transcript_13106/g.43343 Transcript_13106/m.43343 type:complete len:206 (-) Transcript_13106:739-1356(-)
MGGVKGIDNLTLGGHPHRPPPRTRRRVSLSLSRETLCALSLAASQDSSPLPYSSQYPAAVRDPCRLRHATPGLHAHHTTAAASAGAGLIASSPSNCAASFSRTHCIPESDSTAPPPNAIAPSPLTPGGSLGAYSFAATSGWTTFSPLVGWPAARSATTSAASLPASTAPSIEPRNFCEVQSPARVKRGMGVSCEGRYLLRPGMAA